MGKQQAMGLGTCIAGQQEVKRSERKSRSVKAFGCYKTFNW